MNNYRMLETVTIYKFTYLSLSSLLVHESSTEDECLLNHPKTVFCHFLDV